MHNDTCKPATDFHPLYCLPVQDYADYTGKFGAAGIGLLAAVLSVARGKRRFAWG